MKNKSKKIFVIFIIFLILISIFCQEVRGFEVNWNLYEGNVNSTTPKSIANIMGVVINVFQTFAAGVAILMLIGLGIHYMYIAPEAKAQYKKQAVPFVIGAILVFAAVAIMKIIQMLASSFIDLV